MGCREARRIDEGSTGAAGAASEHPPQANVAKRAPRAVAVKVRNLTENLRVQ